MNNIILIGMPSAGKSTIGNKLTESLNNTIQEIKFKFVDFDIEFEKIHNITPSQYFRDYGEDKFRDEEVIGLKTICNNDNQVIATGGGCITRKENYFTFRSSGLVIWINRDLKYLSIANRSLAKKYSIESMYEQRKELYARFADIVVNNNNSSIDDCVNKINEYILERESKNGKD